MKANGCLHCGEPTLLPDCRQSSRGFTLVELISVTAIIVILAALAIPAYSGYIEKARVNRAIAELRILDLKISVYKTDNGYPPNALADINSAGLLDPWGRPYQYLRIYGGDIKGKGKLRRDRFLNPLNTDYDLYSMGADGETTPNLNAKQSRDDVVRANSGAFFGLAADF